ncbi:MAG: LD-carboxypeptidase [Desulfobacterales bacterium]
MSRRETQAGGKRRGRGILLPPRLQPGDTIGVAAPASPFDLEQFHRGAALLEAAGFKVLAPGKLFLKNGYLAGTDAQRAQLFMEMVTDPAVKAVLCARGGYGSMRILPRLDFSRIRATPKVVVGFSDLTALLAAIYGRCGLVTFHGPVVAGLPGLDEPSRAALLAAVTGSAPVVISAPDGMTVCPGSGTGPVLAANLTTLCHLVGTPFMPPLRGHILLLEDRGEAPYRVDRMLSHLRLAGCLEKIAGLAFGSFEACGRPDELAQVIAEHVERSRFPVLTGLDIGHGPRNLTIPIGLAATLDADRRCLSYCGPATREPAR